MEKDIWEKNWGERIGEKDIWWKELWKYIWGKNRGKRIGWKRYMGERTGFYNHVCMAG